MKQEPLILGIETAISGGSLSLMRGELEISSIIGEQKMSRAGELLNLIAALFKDNNLQLSQLDFIAISEGPGSFTGIRIGIATAKGLAQGIKCPLIGVSALEALAFSEGKTPIISILPAGREMVYWQKFAELDSISGIVGPRIGKLDEVVQSIFSFESRENPPPVVIESALYKQLLNSRHKILEYPKIKGASDNVAKIISLYSSYLYPKQLNLNRISPKYLSV